MERRAGGSDVRGLVRQVGVGRRVVARGGSSGQVMMMVIVMPEGRSPRCHDGRYAEVRRLGDPFALGRWHSASGGGQ